jgi:hypothetical protein
MALAFLSNTLEGSACVVENVFFDFCLAKMVPPFLTFSYCRVDLWPGH